MNRDSVDLVRRAYSAWNGGDWTTLQALTHKNCELRPSLGAPDGGTTYYGIEGAQAYRMEVGSMLGTISSEMTEILRATAEHVLVRSHARARGATSGIEVDQHFVHAWTITDGRIAGMRSFPTESEALRSFGLPTPPRPSPGVAVRQPRGASARARPDA
jgi:ketosteroid isomerase-like protein